MTKISSSDPSVLVGRDIDSVTRELSVSRHNRNRLQAVSNRPDVSRDGVGKYQSAEARGAVRYPLDDIETGGNKKEYQPRDKRVPIPAGLYGELDIALLQDPPQKSRFFLSPKARKKHNCRVISLISPSQRNAILQWQRTETFVGPNFIDNFMRGKGTGGRYESFTTYPEQYVSTPWDKQCGGFIINPNPSYSWTGKPHICNPGEIKEKTRENGGFGLVAYLIHPDIYEQEEVFKKFFHDASPIDCVIEGKEKISEYEKRTGKTYIAYPPDLRKEHIPLLKSLLSTIHKHLRDLYNVNIDTAGNVAGDDKVEIYVHSPIYSTETLTFHVHIRVNEGRHAGEEDVRKVSLSLLIKDLEKHGKLMHYPVVNNEITRKLAESGELTREKMNEHGDLLSLTVADDKTITEENFGRIKTMPNVFASPAKLSDSSEQTFEETKTSLKKMALEVHGLCRRINMPVSGLESSPLGKRHNVQVVKFVNGYNIYGNGGSTSVRIRPTQDGSSTIQAYANNIRTEDFLAEYRQDKDKILSILKPTIEEIADLHTRHPAKMIESLYSQRVIREIRSECPNIGDEFFPEGEGLLHLSMTHDFGHYLLQHLTGGRVSDTQYNLQSRTDGIKLTKDILETTPLSATPTTRQEKTIPGYAGHDSFREQYCVQIKDGHILAKNGSYLTTSTERHIYVLDKDNNLYVGRREPPSGDILQHPSFGVKGNVICAGSIKIKDGKITVIDLESGHYKPKYSHLKNAVQRLSACFTETAQAKNWDNTILQVKDILAKSVIDNSLSEKCP